jgi:hypothetical protein
MGEIRKVIANKLPQCQRVISSHAGLETKRPAHDARSQAQAPSKSKHYSSKATKTTAIITS